MKTITYRQQHVTMCHYKNTRKPLDIPDTAEFPKIQKVSVVIFNHHAAVALNYTHFSEKLNVNKAMLVSKTAPQCRFLHMTHLLNLNEAFMVCMQILIQQETHLIPQ